MTEQDQTKLSDTFWGMNGFIAAQIQKLYALKAHKKGLMQQLFPSLDEVNG
ncbi:MAG: hypothetical protein ACYC3N_11880 [Halothiobacillus sp.]